MVKCPGCGNIEVRHASSFLKNAARTLTRSRKRYCPKCGCRWHIDAARSFFERFTLTHIIIILLSLIAAYLTTSLNFSAVKRPSSRNPLIQIDKVYERINRARNGPDQR